MQKYKNQAKKIKQNNKEEITPTFSFNQTTIRDSWERSHCSDKGLRLQIYSSSFLPFSELKKMEWVSFVFALSRRTRVFPPASVKWRQASKTAKAETKNPKDRHVSFANAMLEERKEVVCLVFVSTTSCIVVSLHAYTREITLHARKKTNEKITKYLVSLGCISYFKI